MKKLESKMFQKFEDDKLENLNFVTGGVNWVATYRGGVHTDSVDTDSYPDGGDIPNTDYFSGNGTPPSTN